MKFILIILIILLTFNSNAQYCPIEPELSSRNFDWRQQYYTVYIPVNNESLPKTILNPYFDAPSGSQQNVEFLAINNQDFLAEDGWELINYFFGTPILPTNEAYLILYNKYESKLRVFYWMNSTVHNYINHAKLEILFVAVGNPQNQIATHVSGLLEHQNTPMRVIDGYTDQNIVVVTPQKYNILGEGIWLMTDIPVAYDPCTCQFPSQIRIRGIGSGITNISLTGQGIGTMNEVVDGVGNVNTTSIFANGNKLSDGLSKGNAAYKSVNDFASNIDKLLVRRTNAKIDNDIKQSLNSLGYGDQLSAADISQMYQQYNAQNPPPALTEAVKKLFETKVSSVVPDWLKDIVPFASTAVSLLDFFVGGGKTTPPKPKSFNHNMNFTFTGTTTTEYQYLFPRTAVPGSVQTNLQGEDNIRKPVYNNVLGIMNLVETPIFYKAEKEELTPVPGGGFEFNATFSTSYKLAEPIKYTLNPASDLELVDVRAALIFRQCYEMEDTVGPLFEYSLIQEEPEVYRTPYLPLGCMEDFSMFMSSRDVAVRNPCPGHVHLHVIAKLKSPNDKDASFAALYEVQFESAPYDFDDTPENPYSHIPETRTVSNIREIDPKDGRGPLTAWGEITVENDWDVDLISIVTPIRLSEFNEVPLTGIVTGPFGVISIPDCPINEPVDEDYLSEFCNDLTRYNPIITNSLVVEPDQFDMLTADIPSDSKLNIFPNPFGSQIYLRANPNERVEVSSITIMDLSGKTVHRIAGSQFELSSMDMFRIETGNLQSGMYLIRIHSSNGEIFTEKIIKM